jgi:hypothetical protein
VEKKDHNKDVTKMELKKNATGEYIFLKMAFER